MKPTRKLYYPLDITPTVKPKDIDWWIAQDIQREYIRRKNQYISLTKIGRIAKKNNLVKKTTYGFKLYHKKLVDLLVNEY
ncbi:MAG: hypothetical protein JHC31_12055 [Sulfurihydrogenibium sp.]|jgi:hypothetical protein|nr:hypothetical protein [Sulfurihydrogenibium sp.]